MNIENSLTETIRNSDLQNVASDISEIVIDSILEDGVLKELPIISTIVGLSKAARNVKDTLFLKKIIHFLTKISHVNTAQRQKMIDLINKNGEQKISVGEKLIYLLDKCDDHIDAKYIGQFFCGFLENKITYEEFLKGARIIQDIYIGDFERFLKQDSSKIEIMGSPEETPDENSLPLINSGICCFGQTPIDVDDEQDWERMQKYSVTGGEVYIWITPIGSKLKDILKLEK